MLNIKDRIILEANHIITTKETIRQTAERFKLSKSTIHKDLQEKLKLINSELYKKVNEIFFFHNQNRHINGGISTKNKYLGK